MAQRSPHSALLSAGLTGTPNPYLARYRAGAAAQDGMREDSVRPAAAGAGVIFAPAITALDSSVRLCDDLLAELNPSSLLSVPTETFSSKFSSRSTVRAVCSCVYMCVCVCVRARVRVHVRRLLPPSDRLHVMVGWGDV